MKLPFVTALLALASCASPPDKIAAKSIDETQFAAQTCPQLTETLRLKNAELDVHASMQRRTADEDAWGVFLVGLPTGSMSQGSGRKFTEDRLATVKGEIVAIQSVQKRKGC